jgi:hypothetical protein
VRRADLRDKDVGDQRGTGDSFVYVAECGAGWELFVYAAGTDNCWWVQSGDVECDGVACGVDDQSFDGTDYGDADGEWDV